MTTRTKCRFVLVLAYFFGGIGMFPMAICHVPVWAIAISTWCFFMTGALFVLAMIGDGKEGLGIKKETNEYSS